VGGEFDLGDAHGLGGIFEKTLRIRLVRLGTFRDFGGYFVIGLI